MTIRELVSAIERKHQRTGITINPPATEANIYSFEKAVGFDLPADFKEFYSVCNGFGCTEDIFNMLALDDILQDQDYRGENWFNFAEYMVCSDMWGVKKINDSGYEIFNDGQKVTLTTSLQEFLERYLIGNVFDEGGLFDWEEEIKAR